MKIGFLMNPVAGMGGSVGLKGSDGEQIQEEALRRGAQRVSPNRARLALASIDESLEELEILTAGDEMGENALIDAGLQHEVVFGPRERTSRSDTVSAVKEFAKRGVELVVFVGGDGTARDVLEIVGGKVPILGVPSGVKMHSAVFLNRPDDLGPVVSAFARTKATKEAEVMDIDERLFRKGVVKAKLYGVALVPDDRSHLQTGKASYESVTAEDEAREIGQYIADLMEPGETYIVGPGTTTSFICTALEIEKTLLGVDIVSDKRLMKADATENDILRSIESNSRATIIVSPIGSQGFFLGRGNQQISAKVVKAVGPEKIIVVATPTKLKDTKILRVDSGDPHLDGALRGRIKVITGYKRRRLVEVR